MRSRRLAWGLIAYGVFGLILVIGGAVVGISAAGRIEELASAADGTLSAAARSTRAAADSFASVDGSLSDAQASAAQAASLAREASGTFDSLSAAMSISIFGSQPLQSLGSEFAASADQADALAGTLDAVGGSLGDTRTDVGSIGVELESLGTQLSTLQGSGVADGGSPPLRLFIGLLLSWLAIPAIGALMVGIAMLRSLSTARSG